jgi:hypothetical protein
VRAASIVRRSDGLAWRTQNAAPQNAVRASRADGGTLAMTGGSTKEKPATSAKTTATPIAM